MTEAPTKNVSLSVAEQRLIQSLRELPESVVKDKVHGVLQDLLFYVRNPRCQGVMPEGYPCGDPRSTCEECHQIWDLLEQIEARVARSVPE
jgi:hypothetical protein